MIALATLVEIDLARGNTFDLARGNTFDFTIPGGGRVIKALARYVTAEGLIKRPSHLAPKMTTMVKLIAQVDPKAAPITRRIVVLPMDRMVEPPTPVEFIDMVETEEGKLVALYQAVIEPPTLELVP